VNRDITSDEVRCIAPDGEQLGVMKTLAALAEAEGHGLDLVEVSPNADPAGL
jgi:translation initiation factor IF-3